MKLTVAQFAALQYIEEYAKKLCGDKNGELANVLAMCNLNHYIEAQVHGQVSLLKDVEILVADPSYKNTPIEQTLLALCDKFDIQLNWHRAFRTLAEKVPANFRGPTMPSLAKRITRDGYIDAYAIGLAAQDLKLRPENWRDRGSYETVLQELKLLWHVVVEFGDS